MLCSVERGAQRRAGREGNFSMDVSARFGKELLSRNLRETGQIPFKFQDCLLQTICAKSISLMFEVSNYIEIVFWIFKVIEGLNTSPTCFA